VAGTTAATLDIYACYTCVDKIIEDAAQNGTYSKAFELGVYFQRVMYTDIILGAIYKDAPLNQSETARVLRRSGRAYFDKVNALATKLSVSPSDICEAAGWENCQKTVVPDFNKWATVPK